MKKILLIVWVCCVAFIAQAQVESGKYYKLTAKHSGQALDVVYGYTYEGARVQQWPWASIPSQVWKLDKVDGDYYTITSYSAGRVLDVPASDKKDGATVHLWTSTGTDAQKWKLIPVDNGYYKIEAKHSQKVLDVAGGMVFNGTIVWQWTFGNGDGQKWKIEPVDVNTLKKTQVLKEIKLGEEFKTPDGNLSLVFQKDGDLVINNVSAPRLWASNTANKGATKMVVETNGIHFVTIYDANNKVVWRSSDDIRLTLFGNLFMILSLLKVL